MKGNIMADNHPTAAPLSREIIERILNKDMHSVLYVDELCIMALASLDRPSAYCKKCGQVTEPPVPSDMAEDVRLRKDIEQVYAFINHVSDDDFIDVDYLRISREYVKKSIDHIVAHLSQKQISTVPRTPTADTSGLPDKGGLVAEDSSCASKDYASGARSEATPRVENLSPRDAAPSVKDLAHKLCSYIGQDCVMDENPVETPCDTSNCTVVREIRQAIDQARAEGLEMAAARIEKLGLFIAYEPDPGDAVRHQCAQAIRALIPAGQQPKGDGK